MPMFRLWAGMWVMSAPETDTVPASARSNPAAMRSAVVFPQPDGPSRLTSSPGCSTRSSPSSATTGPNVLRMEL